MSAVQAGRFHGRALSRRRESTERTSGSELPFAAREIRGEVWPAAPTVSGRHGRDRDRARHDVVPGGGEAAAGLPAPG